MQDHSSENCHSFSAFVKTAHGARSSASPQVDILNTENPEFPEATATILFPGFLANKSQFYSKTFKPGCSKFGFSNRTLFKNS